ncbi:MAG TPA: hypothetical protein VGM91_21230 [Conexibacter sp.]|jgi:hypothetical protein
MEEIDWKPLERALPRAWLGGWMFMGYIDGPAGDPLHAYKHGITRRCLHLRIQDGRLEAYRSCGRGVPYAPAVLEEEIEDAYATIERNGATRETAYNEAYVTDTERRFAEAGWSVIRVIE